MFFTAWFTPPAPSRPLCVRSTAYALLAALLSVHALADLAFADAVVRAEKLLDAWRFQPGHAITEAPKGDDWIRVTLPYVWTSGRHSKDGKGRSWVKTSLRALNSAWFETDAQVPPDWQSKRLYLDLSGVQCDIVVWANGQRVGEVKGPDGRVDITGAVKAGQTAQLRLWVTKWWEGTTNQRAQDVFRDRAIKELASSQWYHSEDDVRKALPAGIEGGVTLRAVPREAEIDDVVVDTSYRRKEFSVRVTYEPLTAAATQLRVQVVELDGRTAGLPDGTVALQRPGASASPVVQTVTLPWANPHLWEVGAGYLYRLRVSLLGPDNKVIDAYPLVRFGFREIWTEGRELILNGHPLRLRLAYFVNKVPEMLFFGTMGFDAMEMQPNPHSWYGTWGLFPSAGSTQSGANLLDAADEHGWAVLMSAPSVNQVRNVLGKPEVQKLYLHDLHAWFRESDRVNHPSILMWAPSMNTGGFYDPKRIGRKPSTPPQAWYGEVEKLIKSVDPTRLVFHHAGGQTGDMQTANCYLNFVPLQEREDYLADWGTSGNTPWAAIEHGPPGSMNFFKWSTVPYFTEYAAIYFGDEAYALEKDPYITASLRLPQTKTNARKSAFAGVGVFSKDGTLDHIGDWTAYYRFMDLFIRGTNKAWRAYGLNGGALPWLFDVGFGDPPGQKLARTGWHMYSYLTSTSPALKQRPSWANPLYDAYHDTLQPLLVYIGGPPAQFTAKDHDFYAGDPFEKSIVVVWDGPGSRTVTANWELTTDGRHLAGGTASFSMAPGAIEKHTLSLTAPQVTQRTNALLRIAVQDSTDNTVSRDQLPLTFFPRPGKPITTKARWAIFDPLGETTAMLAGFGLHPRPVVPGDDLGAVDVLVMGTKALSHSRTLPFSEKDVARGLRVVFFEQGVAGLQSLGFRVQDVVPRIVFPRVTASPLLAGIDAAGLHDWRGAGALLPSTSAGMKVWPWPHGPHCGNIGSVASVVIETPQRGTFTPLMNCEFDLAYSPLLLWRDGRGKVVFCQLDVTNRIGLEPAAGILTRNLIRTLDEGPVPTQDNVVFAQEGVAADFVRSLGMRCEAVATDRLSRLADRAHLLVLSPDALRSLSAEFPQLRSWVRSGGTVVCLPQAQKDFAAPSLPWSLQVTSTKLARGTPSQADATSGLLRGVGPQLLHWRTFLELNCLGKASLPPQARRRLDGLLLEIPEGRGRWVFSQVDWRNLNDGSNYLRRPNWNVHKFYRQILTNLGAQTDGAIAKQLLAPRQYAPMVNVSLWQVLNTPLTINPEQGAKNSIPALSAPLPPEKWVADPASADRHEFEWRLRGADKNGYIDFTPVAPAKLGNVGCALTYVYSSVARDASFALSSDWWFVFKVNGKVCVDQGKTGRIPHAPRPGEVRIKAALHKGWNRLEMKVASGSAGFGFWCQISDPGDTRIGPSVRAPATAPATLPPPSELLKEPLVAGQNLLYIEPLRKEDDPYGFTPW